ncbi:MAG: hypothetical protein HFJ91_01665 [Muribaculaceae bacterium]|nr:hypothetical protein [Muribaculaceae bacterium]
MRLFIFILMFFVFQPQSLFADGPSVSIGNEEIRKEAERMERKKEQACKRAERKRQKKSSKIKKLKHMADSMDMAGFMVEMQSVEVVADGVRPFPVYPNLKAAKKAFKEPYLSGGYYRMKSLINRRFRQPMDLFSSSSLYSFGNIVVRFLLDTDGNVTKVKVKTFISQETSDEIERLVRSLPQFYPAMFGGKNFNAIGTMVIDYDILPIEDERERTSFNKKGYDTGNGYSFMKLDEIDIVWTPGITSVL